MEEDVRTKQPQTLIRLIAILAVVILNLHGIQIYKASSSRWVGIEELCVVAKVWVVRSATVVHCIQHCCSVS
jgi:hypothetical protein